MKPNRSTVDFDSEPNKASGLDSISLLPALTLDPSQQVHLCTQFILNGVCVKWVGWIDLDSLAGKARLVFDEDQAKVSPHLCVGDCS